MCCASFQSYSAADGNKRQRAHLDLSISISILKGLLLSVPSRWLSFKGAPPDFILFFSCLSYHSCWHCKVTTCPVTWLCQSHKSIVQNKEDFRIGLPTSSWWQEISGNYNWYPGHRDKCPWLFWKMDSMELHPAGVPPLLTACPSQALPPKLPGISLPRAGNPTLK